MTETTTTTPIEKVTYTDFEIAHTINAYLLHQRALDEHLRTIFNGKRAAHGDTGRFGVERYFAKRTQLVALLTRMNIHFDDKGKIRGILIDEETKLFTGFAMSNVD